MQPESFEPRPGPPPLPPPLPAPVSVMPLDAAWPQQPLPPRRTPRWPLVVGGVVVGVALLGAAGTLMVRQFAAPVRTTWKPQSAEERYRDVREGFAAAPSQAGDPQQVAAID